MDINEKVAILADAAKYDVSCASSGTTRAGIPGGIGNTTAMGICHSWSGDGRCISLWKVLMSNACIYDCEYCVNRRTNDRPRATFTPREIADITIGFYRRNYIEGLFLSSGIIKNPDYTTELFIQTMELLRHKEKFNGYIHAKAIPGASTALIEKLGCLVDRMSINIELPSQDSLRLLAPDKNKTSIVKPMSWTAKRIIQSKEEIKKFKNSPNFVPAGQSTQMIIGASGDSDSRILTLSQAMYKKLNLKRVYYSAYIPRNRSSKLPEIPTPPLLREHRLYQGDWLLRFYGFTAEELLQPQQNLDLTLDPKAAWALNHPEYFPVDVNRAPLEMLLRVPGIGLTGAKRIVQARRVGTLRMGDLKKLNITLKRARYFITCLDRNEHAMLPLDDIGLALRVQDDTVTPFGNGIAQQLSLPMPAEDIGEDIVIAQ